MFNGMTAEQIKAIALMSKEALKEAKLKERNADKKFCFRITEKKGVVFGMGKDQTKFKYGSWANMESIDALVANLENVKKALKQVEEKGFHSLSEDYRYISSKGEA